jgi:hypothetical protein
MEAYGLSVRGKALFYSATMVPTSAERQNIQKLLRIQQNSNPEVNHILPLTDITLIPGA